MSNPSRHPATVSRRTWLHLAGSAAALSATAMLDLKRALAQARLSGKPVFDASLLGSMLSADRQLLAAFAADPVGFLQARFELTPANRAFLAALSPEDLDRVRQAANLAIETARPIAFQAASTWRDPAHRVAAAPAFATRGVAPQNSVQSSVTLVYHEC